MAFNHKKLIFGFQTLILDLKDHFSASLKATFTVCHLAI